MTSNTKSSLRKKIRWICAGCGALRGVEQHQPDCEGG